MQEEGCRGQHDDGQPRQVVFPVEAGENQHRQRHQHQQDHKAQPKAPGSFFRVHVS
jgi:hypothetical protein